MTIVEAPFGDGTDHRRRDQAIDGVALGEPGPEIPRRDIEARDRDALDPPAEQEAYAGWHRGDRLLAKLVGERLRITKGDIVREGLMIGRAEDQFSRQTGMGSLLDIIP